MSFFELFKSYTNRRKDENLTSEGALMEHDTKYDNSF